MHARYVLTAAAAMIATVLTAGALPGLAGDDGRVLSLADGQSPPPARLDGIAGLAGHWRGQGLGGTVEEVWAAPAGGQMMGAFRMIKDDQVAFYEIMTIAEHDGSLVLRLKHFNADLTGWEDKDQTIDFTLVRMDDQAAYFDGMTLRRDGPDAMTVFVRIGQDDGPQIATFSYRR